MKIYDIILLLCITACSVQHMDSPDYTPVIHGININDPIIFENQIGEIFIGTKGDVENQRYGNIYKFVTPVRLVADYESMVDGVKYYSLKKEYEHAKYSMYLELSLAYGIYTPFVSLDFFKWRPFIQKHNTGLEDRYVFKLSSFFYEDRMYLYQSAHETDFITLDDNLTKGMDDCIQMPPIAIKSTNLDKRTIVGQFDKGQIIYYLPEFDIKDYYLVLLKEHDPHSYCRYIGCICDKQNKEQLQSSSDIIIDNYHPPLGKIIMY